MMRFLYPLCLMLPLAACTSTYVEDLASEEFAPVYPADGLQDQGGLPTGGWTAPIEWSEFNVIA